MSLSSLWLLSQATIFSLGTGVFLFASLLLVRQVQAWSEDLFPTQLRLILSKNNNSNSSNESTDKHYRTRQWTIIGLVGFYAVRFSLVTLELSLNQSGQNISSQAVQLVQLVPVPLLEAVLARHLALLTGGGGGGDTFFLVTYLGFMAFGVTVSYRLYLARDSKQPKQPSQQPPSQAQAQVHKRLTITWAKYQDLVLWNWECYCACAKTTTAKTPTSTNTTTTNDTTIPTSVQVDQRRLIRLVITAVAAAAAMNRSTLLPMKEAYQRLVSLVALILHPESGLHSLEHFFSRRRRLRHFPAMSLELRLRFIRLLMVMKLVNRITLRFSFIAINLFMAYVFWVWFLPLVPVWSWPLYLLDWVAECYLMLRLLTLALLLVCFSSTSALFYRGSIRQWDRGLASALSLYAARSSFCSSTAISTQPSSSAFGLLWFRGTVARYHWHHTSTTVVMLRSNRELWSSVTLISVLTQVPSNVYLVYRIYLGFHSSNHNHNHNGWWWQLFLVTALGTIQALVLAGTLLPLAGCSRAVHRAANCLLPATLSVMTVAAVDGPFGAGFGFYHGFTSADTGLRAKWKLYTLYERLSACGGGQSGRKRYGITVGPLKTVTTRAIGQLVLLYLVGVLAVIRFFESAVKA